MIFLWYTLLGFDFDEVMMLAMGFAGLAYIVVDLKRERRLDQIAIDISERVARLEANSDDALTVEARLVRLEAGATRDERFEERLSGYAERIARVEMITGVDQSPNLDQRVTAIEHGTEEATP